MSEEIGGGTLGVIGAGIVAAITGALSWIAGRGRRNVEAAETRAETEIIDRLREEVARLSARMTSLEESESRLRAEASLLRSRVWELEAHIQRAGISLPPSSPVA